MKVTLPQAEWTRRADLAALVTVLGKGNARYVGGAVRDTLLGIPVKDVDLATPLEPRAVMQRLKEAGIQGFEYSTWFGITLPKGTPKDITDRLNAEVVKALADPEMRRRFAEVGLRPDGGNPQAMTTIVRDQLARYGKAIKDNGIKGD